MHISVRTVNAYGHGPKVAVPPVTMRGQGLAVQFRPDKLGNDERIAGKYGSTAEELDGDRTGSELGGSEGKSGRL